MIPVLLAPDRQRRGVPKISTGHQKRSSATKPRTIRQPSPYRWRRAPACPHRRRQVRPRPTQARIPPCGGRNAATDASPCRPTLDNASVQTPLGAAPGDAGQQPGRRANLALVALGGVALIALGTVLLRRGQSATSAWFRSRVGRWYQYGAGPLFLIVLGTLLLVGGVVDAVV